MSTETLERAVLSIGAAEGRTLSGMAVPYDRPTLVRDNVGGPFPGRQYHESFAPTSGDVSMRNASEWPLYAEHNLDRGLFGTVTFQRSDAEGGTVFEAVLSNTPSADAQLELVHSGAQRSVSVGFGPVKSLTRSTATGPLLYRTEVRYRELSLAPTGKGQYKDAMVQMIRAEGVPTPVLDAMKRRAARLHGV